jgi:probable F420-dependent oxidoreductase
VKLDARLDVADLTVVPELSAALERLGYDGVFAGEAGYDPFLQVAMAAEHTSRLELGTGVAIALARNPVETAQTAHDLQKFSRGRFILGLGTQVRTHLERRYGAEWSRPADRIREFVLALRAIWRCWNDSVRLDFNGEFYRHTLMTPLFNPGPNPYGEPVVFLAALGPRMCEVAGEVADGVLLHSFVTARYARDVVLPAVARGLARSGRRRDEFQVSCRVLLAVRDSEVDAVAQDADLRSHIAFFGATRAYGRVLEHHGWGDLQRELHQLQQRGDSAGAAELISDEVLDEFAIRADPAPAAKRIADRFGGIADRIVVPGPYTKASAAWHQLVRASFSPV